MEYLSGVEHVHDIDAEILLQPKYIVVGAVKHLDDVRRCEDLKQNMSSDDTSPSMWRCGHSLMVSMMKSELRVEICIRHVKP